MSTQRTAPWLYGLGGLLLVLVLVSVSSTYASSPFTIHISNSTTTIDLLEQTQNATLGFQKIFVINLASRTDRRDGIALAASSTSLEIDFINAATGADRKTLPPGKPEQEFKEAELGNWRSHLNAARMMVEHSISSALILEDDVDWDLRIKDQMRDFAKATRLLVQPLPGTDDSYLDPSFPKGDNAPSQPVTLYTDQQSTSKPIDSPYGDLRRWDMLWIGHCGTQVPQAGAGISTGRVAVANDETVPEHQHIHIEFGDQALVSEYPNHTRLVHRAHNMLCTLGYALSLRGAKRLLNQASLVSMVGQTDLALGAFCDGHRDYDLKPHMCLTVQPQLFNHHRPKGKQSTFSDISVHNDNMNEQAFTRNIRWSTRLNLLKLIDEETDYVDLFKDGEDSPEYGWHKR